jgi:hypothetical protein
VLSLTQFNEADRARRGGRPSLPRRGLIEATIARTGAPTDDAAWVGIAGFC